MTKTLKNKIKSLPFVTKDVSNTAYNFQSLLIITINAIFQYLPKQNIIRTTF